jgi:hypothetical protein
MINREPPRMAVWLLKQWASPYQRESMVGDLLEMYRSGRSRTWYWGQVIAALILARVRVFRTLPHTGFGTALLRLVNALLLAGIIALGIGSLTQADTTRIDSTHSDTHSR